MDHAPLKPLHFCEKCPNNFTTIQGLRYHEKVQHDVAGGKSAFPCTICEKKFPVRPALVAHQLTHIPFDQRKAPCTVCGKIFITSRGLRKHIHEQHGNTVAEGLPFECTYCEKKFRTQAGLAGHIRTHTGEKPYKCPKCKTAFARDSDRLDHMECVHNTKGRIHACPTPGCAKRFKTVKILRQHCTTHAKERRMFPCPSCAKQFVSKGGMEYHMKFQHEDQEWPHSCTICEQKFRCTSHLTGHLRTHTGEKPYGCTVCPRKYSTSTERSRHVAGAHMGERRHGCSVCGKMFKTSKDLKGHMELHKSPGERKVYTCTECAKTFKSKNGLTGHTLVTHAGEEKYPHTCPYCGKKFAASGRFGRHLRSHTGEKPHGCPRCDRRFADKPTLLNHLNKIHEQEES